MDDFASSGIFYAIAGIIILFALLSVTLRNIFHSALPDRGPPWGGRGLHLFRR